MYSRALACTGGIFVPGEGKTKKSRRSVRLTTATLEALHAHLSRQSRGYGAEQEMYLPTKGQSPDKGQPLPLLARFPRTPYTGSPLSEKNPSRQFVNRCWGRIT